MAASGPEVGGAGGAAAAAPRALWDALRTAIADRRGYFELDVDRAGWRVDLLAPERERFWGGTLEEAPTWRLVWLMVEELGGGAADVTAPPSGPRLGRSGRRGYR